LRLNKEGGFYCPLKLGSAVMGKDVYVFAGTVLILFGLVLVAVAQEFLVVLRRWKRKN